MEESLNSLKNQYSPKKSLKGINFITFICYQIMTTHTKTKFTKLP